MIETGQQPTPDPVSGTIRRLSAVSEEKAEILGELVKVFVLGMIHSRAAAANEAASALMEFSDEVSCTHFIELIKSQDWSAVRIEPAAENLLLNLAASQWADVRVSYRKMIEFYVTQLDAAKVLIYLNDQQNVPQLKAVYGSGKIDREQNDTLLRFSARHSRDKVIFAKLSNPDSSETAQLVRIPLTYLSKDIGLIFLVLSEEQTNLEQPGNHRLISLSRGVFGNQLASLQLSQQADASADETQTNLIDSEKTDQKQLPLFD